MCVCVCVCAGVRACVLAASACVCFSYKTWLIMLTCSTDSDIEFKSHELSDSCDVPNTNTRSAYQFGFFGNSCLIGTKCFIQNHMSNGSKG